MDETRDLARFVADTAPDAVPPRILDLIKVFVLDNLAAGFVGAPQPWARAVSAVVHDMVPQPGDCSVFGEAGRVPLSYAALINGVAIGGFEVDHFFLPGSAHPSASVFPVALALAEQRHLPGRAFLSALALGYELQCRVGFAATRAVEDKVGFHGPATNGVFGGAAVAARLLGLDAEGVTNALGIAGSHAGGLMEFFREGAMTKRLHVGRAGQMGLESALLAQKGFTGPSTVLEGPTGYFNVFSRDAKPERVHDGLGQRWLLEDVSFKQFACHGTQQAIVQAIVEWKRDTHLDPQDARRVTLRADERVIERHTDAAPRTVLGMQYSLPFAVAVALLRDVEDPGVFNKETLWDERVRALAGNVVMVADHEHFNRFPSDVGAQIEIELASGTRELFADDFRGSQRRPFTWDDAEAKFLRWVVPLTGERHARKVVTEVARLEELHNVATLAQKIAG